MNTENIINELSELQRILTNELTLNNSKKNLLDEVKEREQSGDIQPISKVEKDKLLPLVGTITNDTLITEVSKNIEAIRLIDAGSYHLRAVTGCKLSLSTELKTRLSIEANENLSKLISLYPR